MCLTPGINRLTMRKRPVEGVVIDIQDDVVNVELFVILKSDINIHEAGRQVQVDVARASLKSSQSRVDKMIITAPFDGVISTVQAKQGQWQRGVRARAALQSQRVQQEELGQ